MKQKIITLIVVVIIAILLSAVVIASNNSEKQAKQQKVEALQKSEPILYYGSTCSHCQELEAWLATNQIEEKIPLTQKEVYNNQQNAMELNEVAALCGFDAQSIPVPFLYAENQCLTGSLDIIQYFGAKLGIDTNKEASQATSSAIIQTASPAATQATGQVTIQAEGSASAISD
jgi:glutaredoxin